MNSRTVNHGRVAIDKTVGKSTEFRFAYQGSPVTVILTNPFGVMMDVHKEEGDNVLVFKPAGLTEVTTVLRAISRSRIKKSYTFISNFT